MMNLIILWITLVAELLAAAGVAISIYLPQHRIWPPPSHQPWRGYLMWLFFITAAVGVVILGLVDWHSAGWPGWLRWVIGAPLWLAGNILALWAVIVLGIGSTFGDEAGLVKRGPYRFSRNPQYVGFMIGLIGWGLVTGSTMTLVAALVGIVPLLLVPFAEEPWLKKRYGSVYEAYRQTVPRFILWW